MSSPQSYLGTLNNRDLIRDWLVDDVAASTKLTAGMATYVDGNNGRKPAAANTAKTNVRIVEQEADNSGNATKGAIKVTTVGSGAIIGVKAGGAIPVRSAVKTAADGEVVALAEPTDAAELLVYVQTRIGVYLGKPGEADRVDVEPSAAADGDEIFIRTD